MTHLTEDVLNDWADGSLDGRPLESAERHMANCVACRARARAIRELVQELRAMPREVAPPATLRMTIAERIDAVELHGRRWWDRTVFAARVPLAAAAVVLVALTATITARLVSTDRQSTAVVDTVFHDPEFVAAEARYRRATAELEALLVSVRPQLAPETARLIDRNLAVLDAALDEARAALGEDPDNTTLTEMLLASYEKKLDLLRSAAAHAST